METGENTQYALDALLNRKTVTELRKMAKGFKIRGYSKQRKQELIAGVSCELQDQDRFRELLYVLDPPLYQLFQQAAERETPLPVEESLPQQWAVLSNFCYLVRQETEEGVFVLVPVEIRRLFAQCLEQGLEERKQRADLLHQYAMAAVNLYGGIHVEEFLRLFNGQNQEASGTEELFPVLIRHIAAGAPYCFWKGYILSDAFKRNDFQDVPGLIKAVGDKPRYIPEQEEFLRYANWQYYEYTEQIGRLKEFLLLRCGLDDRSAEKLLSDVHFACTIRAGVPRLLNMFRSRHVQLPSGEIGELTRLIVDVSNHTRLWADNGHTPNELYRKHNFLTDRGNTAGKKKIGRNDPCPCGSGKKYKNCCGR